MPTIRINNKYFPIGEIYQNIYGTDIKPKRDCWERMRTILTADRSFNNGALENSTVCDIGSNLGYFLFKLAETNKNKMLGVEVDKNAIDIAEEINKGFSNISFLNKPYQHLEEEFNSYLCLSIFHHNLSQGFDFLNRISKHAKTIYVEQATHLEWAYFGKNMTCENSNPYVFWKRMLEEATEHNFNVRLIGFHRTHLNTIRPMYQLKRKINETIIYGDKCIIYDKWKVPYMEFGLPRTMNYNKPVCLPREKTYMYGVSEDKHYFIKEQNGIYRLYDKYEGFLLSDIIRWGMLPFYNRLKLREQFKLVNSEKHNDATPWNFIVDEDSNIYPIDYDDNPSFISQPYLVDLILNII